MNYLPNTPFQTKVLSHFWVVVLLLVYLHKLVIFCYMTYDLYLT